MEAATFLKEFGHLADAPNGVQKLRELVLQLAVRGKLVEQRPSDGTVAALVSRLNAVAIAAPFEIPPSWSCVRLGDFGVFFGGGTPSKQEPSFWAGDIPWVSPKDMKVRYIADAIDHISAEAVEKSSTRMIPAPALLMVVRGMILAHSFPVAISRRDLTINQDMKGLHLHVPEMAEYLVRACEGLRDQMLANVERSGHGTCRLPSEKAADFPIPLPPLAEQHRIVAKVDELLKLCDELEAQQARRNAVRVDCATAALARLTAAPTPAETAGEWSRVALHFDTLFAVPQTIPQLRQTILQLAVTGRLVKQEEGEGTAATVLKAIRSALPSKDQAAHDLVPDLPADLHPIPSTWKWTTLGRVILGIESGWSPQCEGRPKRDDEWGVLKVSAVSWDRFLPNENKALPSGLEVRHSLEVRSGDFLMSRANTSALVAKSVVVDETPPRLLLCDKVLRVFVPAAMNPRFLNLVNNSPQARDYYARTATGTSESMRNVSREQIRGLPFPLPPSTEQDRIVEAVNTYFKLLDALESQLTTRQGTAERLTAAMVQAVLDGAGPGA